jgi:UDP-2,4-diacetamido-2,4,6-trideoxy-beta-L-altropyranose hydrolase
MTLAVIRSLRPVKGTGFHVRVIVGVANPNRELLNDEASRGPCQVEFVNAATEMPDLMAWADLAISAAGSTCWELAFMSVLIITIIQAENQQFIAESLAQSGVALNAGWPHAFRGEFLAEIVSHLVGAPEMRKRMNYLGQTLVDGFGAQRVAETLGGF